MRQSISLIIPRNPATKSNTASAGRVPASDSRSVEEDGNEDEDDDEEDDEEEDGEEEEALPPVAGAPITSALFSPFPLLLPSLLVS